MEKSQNKIEFRYTTSFFMPYERIFAETLSFDGIEVTYKLHYYLNHKDAKDYIKFPKLFAFLANRKDKTRKFTLKLDEKTRDEFNKELRILAKSIVETPLVKTYDYDSLCVCYFDEECKLERSNCIPFAFHQNIAEQLRQFVNKYLGRKSRYIKFLKK